MSAPRRATLRVGVPRHVLAGGRFDVDSVIPVDMPRWRDMADAVYQAERVPARITRSEVVEEDAQTAYVLVELDLEEQT